MPDGITASVAGDRVLVETGAELGTKTLTYTIRDDKGASAVGALVVTVEPDVPLLAPIARDDRVTVAEIGADPVVDVAVLENDEDPDGVPSEMSVSTDEEDVTVRAGGVVRVPVTTDSRIVRYTVTDGDGLTASAFILVPGLADLRPSLRSDGAIEVASGETIEIPLSDYVVVAGGGRAIITEAAKVSAVHANGDPLVRDAGTLVYTSADRYFGADALTFEVTDGAGPDDPDGRVATLSIPITVLPPDNEPPTLSGATMSIAPGEDATTLDLRGLASDPNVDDIPDLAFRLVSDVPGGYRADVSDGVLSVSADAGTSKGSSTQLQVEVTDGKSDPVRATVSVTVTASTRELATVTDDVVAEAHQGVTQNIDVLANDQSPFPGEPLTIVDLIVETGETASPPVKTNDGRVAVTPADDFVGSLIVRYRVQDATRDPDREVDGRIRLTVQGRPATPGIPTVSSVQDRTVVLSWSSPSNNGAEITKYTVTSTSGAYTKTCAATTCTLDGLTNNVEYNFVVTATNRVGESDPSLPSATARPDARPDTPQPPTLVFGDKSLQVSWVTPTTPGSPVESFDLEISPAPPSGVTQKIGVTGNTVSWDGLENGTAYQVRVRAVNRAPEPSSWSSWSATEIPAGAPAAPAAPTTERLSPVGNQAQLRVNWAPPYNNGADISQYVLRVQRGGSVVATLTPAGGATSQVINVDASTSDYTFDIAARNKAGLGAASAPSAPRRAFTPPGAPTGLTAAEGDNRVTISATAGAGNGASASELDYQYSVSGGAWNSDWVSLTKGSTITGTIGNGKVNNNGTYTIAIRAVNRLDGQNYEGPASGSSNAVAPYGAPRTPQAGASASGKTITYSWTAPAPNGRAVSLEISIDGGGWENVGGSGNRSVGYGYSQTHSIRVRTLDAAGQRSGEASASARTANPPAPTTWAITAPSGGTCLQPDFTYSRFNANGPSCSSTWVYARDGAQTATCFRDLSGWAVQSDTVWFWLPARGAYMSRSGTSGSMAGMPAC